MAFIYPVIKTLIVPVIGLCWYTLAETHPTLIIAYIVFAALGDLFLLSDDFRVFVVGGAFFFASHVLMSIQFNVSWICVPWWGFVMMIPNILLIAAFLIPAMFPLNFTAVSFVLYAFFLEIGACSSIARVHRCGLRSPSFWLCSVGYLMFLGSDAMLLRARIRNNVPVDDIVIMGLYVAAQVGILLGMANPPPQHMKSD